MYHHYCSVYVINYSPVPQRMCYQLSTITALPMLSIIPHYYTQRNNSINLQYEHLLSLHEDFKRILHEFMCALLSKIAQDVDSTVQDVETKGGPVNPTTFSYWRFFNRNTYLK